jgi:hypothetical protein
MLEKRNRMNEAEEQERECRRHGNEGWNCERVSRECFPVAEPYADPPSPFTEAWLAKCRAEIEEQDAKLVAWIDRMKGQICCGGTPDELGYCPHGPHRTGTKCQRFAADRLIGSWYVDLLDEIEAICEGELDVWTGYGEGDAATNESGSGRGG